MRYWFMRMRQGSDGPDYSRELWERVRVGVLFGHWKMDEVLDASGATVDPARLSSPAVEGKYPPFAAVRTFHRWSQQVAWFLLKMQPDDRVLVAFDSHIHIG